MPTLIGRQSPKTESLILYIITRLQGGLGRTRLIKLAYLSDCVSRMLRSKPITNFRYLLFDHGPFDPVVYDAVKCLIQKGYIQEKEMPEWDGYRYEVLRSETTFDLTDEERFIADRVVERYGRIPLVYLLDEVVYKTEPARKAKEAGILKTPLEMEACDGLLQNKYGIDLDTYLKSEEARRKGDLIPLDDVIDAL